jgi:hypothetical protein
VYFLYAKFNLLEMDMPSGLPAQQERPLAASSIGVPKVTYIPMKTPTESVTASATRNFAPATTSEAGIDWQQMVTVKGLPDPIVKEWYAICNRGCSGNNNEERSDVQFFRRSGLPAATLKWVIH